MNTVWTYPDLGAHVPRSRRPGMEALRRVLNLLLGLRIDYYVLVDMANCGPGGRSGGLDIYITETMDVGFSPAREGEDPVRVTSPSRAPTTWTGTRRWPLSATAPGRATPINGAPRSPCVPWPLRSTGSPWPPAFPRSPGRCGRAPRATSHSLPSRPGRVRHHPGSQRHRYGRLRLPVLRPRVELPQPPHRGPGADPRQGSGGAGHGGDGGGCRRSERCLPRPPGALTTAIRGRRRAAARARATTTNRRATVPVRNRSALSRASSMRAS